MHHFDKDIKKEKERKAATNNNNMLSMVSNNKGSLDMLFASSFAPEVQKSDLPKELQYYVDNLNQRIPEGLEEFQEAM